MVYRACGSQSGNCNATPAAAGGDKDPGVGDAGRVLRCGKPPGQSSSGLTWEPGRCGGRDGAEVVVRRSGRGSAADYRQGRIAGQGREAVGLSVGRSWLLRSPAGL